MPEGISARLGSNIARVGAIAQISATCSLHGAISEIHSSLGRITQIVNSLKAYSYMDQAPVQLLNVHDGLNNTLVILRTTLNDNITVVTDYAPDLPRIQGYGSELNLVWTNILDNAVSAIDGGGEIAVRTRLSPPWAVIEFQDSGAGIPIEIQSRVFDPFFTTKPPDAGVGLGLTISHNIIVQKHHGQISLASEPGNTCFQVRLPLDGQLQHDARYPLSLHPAAATPNMMSTPSGPPLYLGPGGLHVMCSRSALYRAVQGPAT